MSALSNVGVLCLCRKKKKDRPCPWIELRFVGFRELKRNKIRVVDSLIFKELEALKSLKMQRNGITKLMDGALFGLENMEEL